MSKVLPTKAEFFKNLIWIEGYPPHEDEHKHPNELGYRFVPDGFSNLNGPLVIESKDGTLEIIADRNYSGGYCDCCAGLKRADVTRYAYLYSEPQIKP